jgi:hypothetical protein
MPLQRKNKTAHSYEKFEGTRLWKALNKGIHDLVENRDLKETARREHIVGYLCKVLTQRRPRLFSK